MSINVKKINDPYYEENNTKVLYLEHYIMSRDEYNRFKEGKRFIKDDNSHKSIGLERDLYEYDCYKEGKQLNEHNGFTIDESILYEFERECFCLTIPNNEIEYNQVAFFNKSFRVKLSKIYYILLNDNLYKVSISQNESEYTLEELSLLIKEKIYKSNKKFEQIKKQIELYEKFEAKEKPEQREPIPEDVRFEVWRRDGGKCVICGSNKNLEFDHIIPFSKGGSSTARNIQLLCQECNRRKSDKI